ncbi:MAG: Tat pathway signal sequence domain protein [Bacteroidota bacterium]|nr:Tat pathway signal sequence domain protein [Bacteroidota bacterium]
MKHSLIFSLFICLLHVHVNAQTTNTEVELKWVDNSPANQPLGVSWGVPWPRGIIKKGQSFTLINNEGKSLPLQTWTTAYWPDGSVKWTGFATVADATQSTLKLRPNREKQTPVAGASFVSENNETVTVNTGQLRCVIRKSGRFLIDSLVVNGQLTGSKGRLECVLQNGPDGEDFESPSKEKFVSKVDKVAVEQNGPVRTVIRLQGKLQSEKGTRQWLPFDIRMYFYSGSNAVRLVNTIIYDGEDQKDFIKGLALAFSVPMREQLYNRHVRFGGEGPGIWAEPVKPLLLQNRNVLPDQLAGKQQNMDQLSERAKPLIKDFPVWNDYKLVQYNADGFNIAKRTNTKSVWLDANAGKRARGFVFVGDTKGGLGVGLKDFWQSYPAALEVRDAAKDVAELKVWLWSPYNEAMDMRHYDTVGHGLAAVYEDVQPGLSTPYGIARTSELTLFPSADVPSNENLSKQAAIASQPPLLSATPEYIHAANVFGIWSLPDRSTPGKQWIESQLDTAINFYKKEIDQRNWYGFWNYGDVMHTYDDVRHSWRYDVGGYAWDNTELSTDMWFWYSYLRSGRGDLFRMAEAMTRHTSEVDVYHIGKLAGLGSRHNVRHWGCGSKEVRESQAAYRRFYYYLTTDERTGDIMREVAQQADVAMAGLDPLRLILPKTQYPTHARIGPDWLALVGNWMTEWERTGDKRWRDLIMAGVNSFAKMPHGFFSGEQGAFGYDPATKKMYQLNDTIGVIHLSVLMGGPEVVYELKDLLQDKAFDKMWLQFSKFYGAGKKEQKNEFGKTGFLGALGPWYARMPAYVAKATNDSRYADTAWKAFLAPRTNNQFTPRTIKGADALKSLEEVPDISTNNTAQWCLNAIQLLEMIGDKLPEQHPFWSSKVYDDKAMRAPKP